MKILVKIGWVALALVALVSVAAGFRNGLNFVDFQWVPAKILALGQDPYAYSLHSLRFDGCQVDANQVPSCLLLLWPLTLLPRMTANAVWDVLNLVFVGVFLFFCWRIWFAERFGVVLFSAFAMVLLAGTPCRVLVGNGQHLMFSLAFFLAAYYFAEKGRWCIAGALLAVSAFKYTTIAPMVFIFVARRLWRPLVLAAVLHLAATFFCGWWTGVSSVGLVLDSLKVGGMLTANGDADVASLAGFFGCADARILALVGYALGTIVLVLVCLRKSKDSLLLIAVLSVLSNIMFYHRVYDFVTLAFPLVLVMRDWKSREKIDWSVRVLTIVNVGYTFYFDRALSAVGVTGIRVPMTFALEHLLFVALLAKQIRAKQLK